MINTKNNSGLGYHQRNMINFIWRADANYTKHGRGKGQYSLARDPLSQRVADSLERRGLIGVDRAYTCWMIHAK